MALLCVMLQEVLSTEKYVMHTDKPYIDFLCSGNQQRGGRGTPTNSSSVTPVAIVTAKEERSSQPVVANLAALPGPAATDVLPDSQPLPLASDIPVSSTLRFNAAVVFQYIWLNMRMALLFCDDHQA
jgi:hypothetical protein